MIISILVLGFMMAVSYSYTIMESEIKAALVEERVERAKSAALAGVNYVHARLLATNTTFLVTDQQSDYRKRLYYARTADISSDRTNRFSGLIVAADDFKALVSSSWLYALIPTLVLEDECASSTMFRVTSYPATNDDGTINPHKYYVKSQGAF